MLAKKRIEIGEDGDARAIRTLDDQFPVANRVPVLRSSVIGASAGNNGSPLVAKTLWAPQSRRSRSPTFGAWPHNSAARQSAVIRHAFHSYAL
jgi:hypothetical protein